MHFSIERAYALAMLLSLIRTFSISFEKAIYVVES